MLSKELLDIMGCAQCKGELEYDIPNARLICHACKLRYPVQDDIPIMLIEEAERFDATSKTAD